MDKKGRNEKIVDWTQERNGRKNHDIISEIKRKLQCPRGNRLKWKFNKGRWRKAGKQPREWNDTKEAIKRIREK